jgi:hypothetical protein
MIQTTLQLQEAFVFDILFLHFFSFRCACVQPVTYEQRIKGSWIWKELEGCRNVRPSFNTGLGLYGGMAYTGVLWYALRGKEPWTFCTTSK